MFKETIKINRHLRQFNAIGKQRKEKKKKISIWKLEIIHTKVRREKKYDENDKIESNK